MSSQKTYYAVRRGDKWLDRRDNWTYKSSRHLWSSKAGVMRAINQVDRVGVEPSDHLKMALDIPNTHIVAVLVVVQDIDRGEVPLTLKRVTKFKQRHQWASIKSTSEDIMPVYHIEKMPE